MESIGHYLKSVRTNQNLSLEDISEMTKIKVRILEYIENDHFELLGGRGYAKAIIVSYAKALKADVDKILNELDSDRNIPKKPFPQRRITPKKLMLPANIFSVILLVILVIALSAFTFSLYKSGKLKNPFRSNNKAAVEKKQEPKKETSKQKSSIVKPKLALKEAPKKIETTNINEKALKDTTDYLNQFMFKDKASPFRHEDN